MLPYNIILLGLVVSCIRVSVLYQNFNIVNWYAFIVHMKYSQAINLTGEWVCVVTVHKDPGRSLLSSGTDSVTCIVILAKIKGYKNLV